MWSINLWDASKAMLSFDFRGHMSSESHEGKLLYAWTQCFIRKVTYSVSRVAGKGAGEKLCPSVSVNVSAAKSAGIDDT